MPHQIELVLDAKAELGEGAIWDAARALLYWVDIDGCSVHVYDPAANSDRAVDVGEQVGTVVPRASGGLVLALKHGFAHLELPSGKLGRICDPERGISDNRFNDGKCDPAGRFWAGTMGKGGSGRFYCLFPDLVARPMLEGVTTSNGIAWGLDAKTMYYIDTPTHKIDAFDYDLGTGAIGNRRTVVTVPNEMGHPDGMTIDADGKLWVALWDGWSVKRWDPENGELLASIPVPAARVTSCAFGGPNLDELYITSARAGISEDALKGQPHAGGLFKAKPGVHGIEAFAFAG